MKIGATFPTTEIGDDPVVIRDWIQTAEGLGYDYVLAYDHVLGAVHAGREPCLAGPYTEKHPFHEPFVLYAYFAGITERIELCTGIVILPQRQTALVAKQAAEIALLSGNRLRLGLGTGWNPVEYEALGVPYAGRGRRLDEQIEVLRALWTESLVDFEGSYHRIDRASILPRPTAPIPLWFGAMSDVAVDRAVREGDGLIFALRPTLLDGMVGKTRDRLEAAGGCIEGFGLEANVDFSVGPQGWRKELAHWEVQGGTHLSLRAMNTGNAKMGLGTHDYGGPRGYVDALEIFMKAIR
ncbi:MAG: LLM class F420-dependent oxidoreductase [Deltaproteobacteria bacterium]|nr:LLM class F420-dependent oxidoreductase [Deltaproteobacteria bacterium]